MTYAVMTYRGIANGWQDASKNNIRKHQKDALNYCELLEKVRPQYKHRVQVLCEPSLPLFSSLRIGEPKNEVYTLPKGQYLTVRKRNFFQRIVRRLFF
tara:strand:+ start:537 stop:830 length:294 start_codon:yes stop_codon:yes gene_type:complete